MSLTASLNEIFFCFVFLFSMRESYWELKVATFPLTVKAGNQPRGETELNSCSWFLASEELLPHSFLVLLSDGLSKIDAFTIYNFPFAELVYMEVAVM